MNGLVARLAFSPPKRRATRQTGGTVFGGIRVFSASNARLEAFRGRGTMIPSYDGEVFNEKNIDYRFF